jgi:hypothetical protein
MPVIPSFSNATVDVSSLTLPRYAQIIRYDETAFFGINKDTDRPRDCTRIWTKMDRDQIARYLGEAQTMIEKVLGYPIGPKWFANEQHHNSRWIFSNWSQVRSLGIRAVSVVASSVVLNHAADPATIPATATTVTDADELRFYQAGTDVEVYPSILTISGGNLTASFPRARLVLEAFQDNPDTGLSYSDTSNSGPYTQQIDIKRIYTDTTDVGVFVWPLGIDCQEECGEDTRPACGYVRSNQSGVINLLPESDGTCVWYGASELRVNYCAGKVMDSNAEDAIMHLAHALMPIPPCEGCDAITMLWKQDQYTPEVLTRARIDCPFGVHEGAWRAWTYAQSNRHVRATFL